MVSKLLDTALHHAAMPKLTNHERRGRPDIAHSCILNALGSPANKSGHLRFFLHTVHDRIFEFNPEIKISRNYNRFKGLITKLLIEGDIVANESPLITEIHQNLPELINSFRNKEVFLFSSRGKTIVNKSGLYTNPKSQNYVAIVGGFQKGSFSEKILNLTENFISISQYSLDAWIVVSRIITYYEIIKEIS
ncbi:MAG: 16S rRNA methyltransferase [Promethearchaeota archaeon]